MVLLPKLTPSKLIDEHEACWLANYADRPGLWPDCIAFRRHPELIAIATYGPLAGELQNLLAASDGIHLNLRGCVSRERNWHQEIYLRPAAGAEDYAAVGLHARIFTRFRTLALRCWITPGWPQVPKAKWLEELQPLQGDVCWPKHCKRWLTPTFEQVIQDQEAQPISPFPHGVMFRFGMTGLLHRGSTAMVPQMGDWLLPL